MSSADNLLEIPYDLLVDDNHPESVKLPLSMPVFEQSSAPQYTLYRLVKQLKPKKILEIGTQGGCSAVAMAFAQRDNGDVVDVTCVDPFIPCGDNDGADTLGIWHSLIHQSGYLGNGIDLVVSTSERFFNTNSEKFDFIVVDGSHHYEFVKYDFKTALRHIKVGGVIWLHDYMIYESVRNAINEVIVENQLPFSINEIQKNGRGEVCGWAIARNWPYRHLQENRDVSIKINLGCGAEYKNDWLNIDSDFNVKADIHADFLNLKELFAASSIDEVEMIHSLGYLNLWEARELLQQVHTILKPGAKFILEVPNSEKAISKIMQGCSDLTSYIDGVSAFHASRNGQLERRENYKPYSFSWTPEHLKQELEKSGFKNVSILPPQTHSEWRDMRIECVK